MRFLILILLLALFDASLAGYLAENPDYYQLDPYTWETEEFRAMNLGEALIRKERLEPETVAALMVEHDYDLREVTDLSASAGEILERRPAAFRKLAAAYETVLEDLEYFPIPKSIREGSPDVTYDDGWQAPRTYGGERGHEGCDIMAGEAGRGYFPVVSMTDGVVEKVGWLEQGGWRIGIRSPGGLYLYYAHLYGYAREWKVGDPVTAGTLLGYMGDTGYSAIPGTTGNFDVHLHVGMYLRTDHYEELSVNPYWALRWLEQYRLLYEY